MKKKVLLTITKSNFGGAQRYVFDLATSLPKEEFDVHVAYGGTGTEGAAPGSLAQMLKDAGVPSHTISAFMRDVSLRNEWKALRELIRLYRTEKPDIVHLNSSKAGGLGAFAARLAGVPCIVFTVHGLPQDEDRSFFARAAITFATWCTFLLCHTVIAVSSNNAERIRRMPLCRKKVRLIHNGVKPFITLPRAQARETLGLPENAFVIGAVGELTANKNYPVLLRAAAQLTRANKEFVVCIVSDGEERTFLKTLAEETGAQERVVFTGFVPNARTLLSAFDIFALPSLKEGLPYVLLEAAHTGLPCVGSDIPGVREVLTEGKTGLLFPPRNEGALAQALTRLIEDASLRETLGAALKHSAEKTFSFEKMITETADAYRS